jgi:hypothetical protein
VCPELFAEVTVTEPLVLRVSKFAAVRVTE